MFLTASRSARKSLIESSFHDARKASFASFSSITTASPASVCFWIQAASPCSLSIFFRLCFERLNRSSIPSICSR